MISINADLHIHSRFSISTSKQMTFKTLSIEAPKKGIQLVGTGDCLFQTWLDELKSLDHAGEGIYELNGTYFIPTVEVQSKGRVHHLIIFPSISSIEQFREKISHLSKNLDSDGRPHVPILGEELAQLAVDVDALIGPCHAFTPWTGMYGYFDSLKDCYGDLFEEISFLELGLSADSDFGDRISELKELTYMSNSDAHSPYPLRLGREFNRFKMKEISYSELKKAILRQGGRKCILNVGLPPEEGKYNKSACSRCFVQYSLENSVKQNWKCSCGGRIKKGVTDRVAELADHNIPKRPKHRPEYVHLIPLSEIIAKALDHANVNTKKVQSTWTRLIEEFDNEINVLLNAEFENIVEVVGHKIARAIQYFRDNKIILHPGGGGKYGEIELPDLDNWF
jgi:uncharacterized protein (TIGR00375 family)